MKNWVNRWRREEQVEKNVPVIRKRLPNIQNGESVVLFEEQKSIPDGGSKDGDEAQELGPAHPGLEHDHMCSGHNGQNKSKLKQTFCLVSQRRVQGRLWSYTISEDWWRPWASCLGGSLPRPLHLPPPLLPHQPLDSGLTDALHLQAPLHWSPGFLWRWRNCFEAEFSSIWHPVHSMSVYFCCVRRGTWYLILYSAELSPKPWGGSKQQSLHATELVHHCAPASVSLLNTSRYLLRLEVCPQTLVPSVYWVSETVMECWGWCENKTKQHTRRTGLWSHTFKCW